MMKNILILFGMVFILGSLVSAAHALPSDLVDDDTGLIEGTGDWANSVTYQIFWTLMLLGFCIVLFIVSINYDVVRAYGYASVAGMLGSITLGIIGWMSWWIASAFILNGAIALAIMSYQK